MFSTKKIHRFFSALALGGVALLFLIIGNIYQPSMDSNMHCMVHDYIVQALGGECDANTHGIFVHLGDTPILFFLSAAVCLLIIAVATVDAFEIAREYFLYHANDAGGTLIDYYRRGIAPSRRFV